jgi:hypothetical protein
MVTVPTLHVCTHVCTYSATRPISRPLDAATVMNGSLASDLVKSLRCVVPHRPGTGISPPLRTLFLLEALTAKIPRRPFFVANDTQDMPDKQAAHRAFPFVPMHGYPYVVRVRTFSCCADRKLTPRTNSTRLYIPVPRGEPLGPS